MRITGPLNDGGPILLDVIVIIIVYLSCTAVAAVKKRSRALTAEAGLFLAVIRYLVPSFIPKQIY